MGYLLYDFNEYFSKNPEDELFYDYHKPFLDDLERWANLCSAAFEKATFISGCIDKKVYFISDSLAELSGYTDEEILSKKENFLQSIIHPADRQFMIRIRDKMIQQLFTDKKIIDNNKYTCRYNIRIKTKKGEWINLECLSYPIYEINNQLHFAINHAKVFGKKFHPLCQVYFTADNKRYIYHTKKEIFIEEKKIRFTVLERKILMNTARGLKEHEIAKEMEMDVNTIKYYKKSILKKLCVKSMPEAIYYALKQNIL